MWKPSLQSLVFAIVRVCGNNMVEPSGRKVKGISKVRLPRGTIRLAEIHWYEAHGIGKKEFKLKLRS